MTKDYRLIATKVDNVVSFSKHLVYFDENKNPVRYHKRSKHWCPGVLAYVCKTDPIWHEPIYLASPDFPKAYIEPQPIKNKIPKIFTDILNA